MQATLVHGANLQIDFGIAAERPTVYTLDWLRPMKKMAVSSYQSDKHGTNVAQLLDLEIEWGREYDLLLFVDGMSVKSFVDEQPIQFGASASAQLSGQPGIVKRNPQSPQPCRPCYF